MKVGERIDAVPLRYRFEWTGRANRAIPVTTTRSLHTALRERVDEGMVRRGGAFCTFLGEVEALGLIGATYLVSRAVARACGEVAEELSAVEFEWTEHSMWPVRGGGG